MNVLLLSMPDSFEHMPAVAHPHAQRRARPRSPAMSIRTTRSRSPTSSSFRAACARPSSGWCASIEPDVVGLSVMTFQRATALQDHRAGPRDCVPRPASWSAATIRAWRPRRTTSPRGVDFIVRGEGEITFRELLRALESGQATCGGDRRPVGYRDGERLRAQPGPPVSALDDDEPSALPNRAARVLQRLHAARPAGRRDRDLARLHLRLQLLLDHRDARPQLPHLPIRSRPRRHPRRRDARRAGASSSSTTTSRSTCTRFEALCRAIIDAGLQRDRLHRSRR